MIPLMKNTFYNEFDTKIALAEFISRTSRFSMNIKCFEFERAFAKSQDRKECILLNSGGSANLALFQAYKNMGRLKEGDKVGFSALTWSTNVMPIIQMGMIPIPIDCEPTTLNVMSENLLSQLKNDKLQAVFLTNALGFTGDLVRIKEVCRENNIVFFEDNCEALGTELPEGKAGNFSLASTFSFFVAHHMSTIEGGAVCTDDEELAEMLRIVRANGWDRNLNSVQQQKWRNRFNIDSEFEAKYTFYDLGFNMRPTEIVGFLGLNQLQYLMEICKQRESNYKRLETEVKKNPDLITLDRSHISVLSNFAFPVLCRTRELRTKYLAQFSGAGVEVRPMIAGNIQRQPFYKKYASRNYDLPGTDFIHDCGFYFGNYPELTDIDIVVLSSCLSKYSNSTP